MIASTTHLKKGSRTTNDEKCTVIFEINCKEREIIQKLKKTFGRKAIVAETTSFSGIDIVQVIVTLTVASVPIICAFINNKKNDGYSLKVEGDFEAKAKTMDEMKELISLVEMRNKVKENKDNE